MKISLKHYGFTLIELMAAMAIVSVIMLIVGRLMTDSQTAFKSGVNTAEMNDYGRAVLDFISKDLSTAIADENIRFLIDSEFRNVYGLNSDRINFGALKSSVENGSRNAQEIVYQIRDAGDDRFELMRSVTKDRNTVDLHTNDTWFASTINRIVAENIAAFEVFAYRLSSSGNPELVFNYDSLSESNTLPVFVDVYIEFLGRSDAEQISTLAENVDVIDRVNKAARRYQTRIYFPNREGYAP